MGLQLAFLLAGTIVIENVFYLPDLDRLGFQAVAQRDPTVVEVVVMLLVASVILVNLREIADPPLKFGGRIGSVEDPSCREPTAACC